MKYNRRHGLNHVVVHFSSASGVGGRSGFGLQSFRPELEMLFSAVRASSYEWYAIGLELIKWKYSLTGDLVQTRPSCSCSGFVFNCSRGRYGTAADNMPVLRFCLMWLCAALITRDRSRAPSCAPAARSWRGGFDWKLACHLRLVTGDAEGWELIKCRENLPLSFVPGWVIWAGLLRSRNELIAGEYTHTTTVYQFNSQKAISTKTNPP